MPRLESKSQALVHKRDLVFQFEIKLWKDYNFERDLTIILNLKDEYYNFYIFF